MLSLPGLEYVIKCSNCQQVDATVNCIECEDSYCKPCFTDLHCKGNRTKHNKMPIPLCGYCKYQMACKTCLTCMTCKLEDDDPRNILSESTRGLSCDTCFFHMHDENKYEAPFSFSCLLLSYYDDDDYDEYTNTTFFSASFYSYNLHLLFHRHALEHSTETHKNAVRDIFTRSKEAYLVGHQLHQRIKTTHNYHSLVQDCEECQSHR